MTRSEEYRAKAAEMRDEAAKTNLPLVRQQHLIAAKVWDSMADREDHAIRQADDRRASIQKEPG
jgi:hypothetical protein